MSYEQTFEEQVEIMQNQRHRKEYNEYKQKERNGEYIYSRFCMWCNGYADDKSRTNPKAFAAWLKQEGIELTQHQRRYLLEHKFGYKVWYDNKEKDWRCEKVTSTT